MARDDPQIKLRLSAELKARVEESAHKAGRSLNAEVVHRLEQSFVDPEKALEPFLNKLISVAEKVFAQRYRNKAVEAQLRKEAEQLGLKMPEIGWGPEVLD